MQIARTDVHIHMCLYVIYIYILHQPYECMTACVKCVHANACLSDLRLYVYV